MRVALNVILFVVPPTAVALPLWATFQWDLPVALAMTSVSLTWAYCLALVFLTVRAGNQTRGSESSGGVGRGKLNREDLYNQALFATLLAGTGGTSSVMILGLSAWDWGWPGWFFMPLHYIWLILAVFVVGSVLHKFESMNDVEKSQLPTLYLSNILGNLDSFVERPVRDGPWSARVSGREAPRAVGC